jgi:hypothetical protein
LAVLLAASTDAVLAGPMGHLWADSWVDWKALPWAVRTAVTRAARLVRMSADWKAVSTADRTELCSVDPMGRLMAGTRATRSAGLKVGNLVGRRAQWWVVPWVDWKAVWSAASLVARMDYRTAVQRALQSVVRMVARWDQWWVDCSVVQTARPLECSAAVGKVAMWGHPWAGWRAVWKAGRTDTRSADNSAN